jgi:hypothetical protein
MASSTSSLTAVHQRLALSYVWISLTIAVIIAVVQLPTSVVAGNHRTDARR